MAESVRIEFSAGGISEVTRAFESVEKAIVRLHKASERDSSRLARDQVRQATQAGKEKERILTQELKNRTRLEIEAAKNVTRLSIEGAKAYERAEREKTRIFLQQERERSRAAQQSAREMQRHSGGGSSFRQVVGGGAAKGLGGLATGAAKVGGMVLAAGGGLAIADALSYETAGQRKAAQISNQISQFTKQRVSTDDIQKLARGAQAKSGVKANELMGGFSEYLAASSDFDPKNTGKSQDMMAFLGKISQATGSDVGDVFRTAGTLKSQNKSMTDDQLKNMFLSVVSQGAEGAVELKDLAKYSEKITSSSAQYQGDQSANQRKLMGLAQLVKPISPTGEIGSSIEHFASDAQNAAHRKKISRALGADLYNAQGQIKSPEEMLIRGMNYAKGDVSKLQSLGFGERGIDVFRAMGGTYNEAAAGTKGTAAEKHTAAMKAVRSKVERQLSASTYGESDLEKDVGTTRGTRGARTEEAFQNLRDKIADNLLPVLDKLVDKLPAMIPHIEKFIEKFGAMVSWLADNPLKGLAAVIGLAIGKEIALAQIGNLLKNALGGGGGAGGAGAAAGGAALPLALAAGGAVQTFATGKGLIDAVMSTKGENEAIRDKAQGDPEEIARKRAQAKANLEVGADDLKALPPMLMADKAFNLLGGTGSLMGGKTGEQIIKDKTDAMKYLEGTDGTFNKKADSGDERKTIETKGVSDFSDALAKATDVLKSMGGLGERGKSLTGS